MTRHYPDLDSASNCLNQISRAGRPIRRTTQIWVVARHQYGISALVSQTSIGREATGSVAKCRLFSQAIIRMGAVIERRTLNRIECICENLQLAGSKSICFSLTL